MRPVLGTTATTQETPCSRLILGIMGDAHRYRVDLNSRNQHMRDQPAAQGQQVLGTESARTTGIVGPRRTPNGSKGRKIPILKPRSNDCVKSWPSIGSNFDKWVLGPPMEPRLHKEADRSQRHRPPHQRHPRHLHLRAGPQRSTDSGLLGVTGCETSIRAPLPARRSDQYSIPAGSTFHS